MRVLPVSSPARRAASESIHQIHFVKCGNMCCYNIDGADDGVVTHGPLIEAKGCVRTEPFSLPDGFRWDNLELSSQGAVSSSCRFTETAISKSGGEIVEKTEQSRLRQTEQGFSVSAEGALHSAE